MWDLLLDLISATSRSTDGWHGQTWLGWREFRIDRAAGSRLWDGVHDEGSGVSKLTKFRSCKESSVGAVHAN